MSWLRRAAFFAAATLIFVSCRAPRPAVFTNVTPGDPPPPDSVDAVLIIVGDAGEGVASESPLLARMKRDIEVWSELVARDSAVTVLFLGDNVYPVGVRDRTDPNFAADSAILWSQINVLGGPNARKRGTIGFFLPGNHDWGNMAGASGLRRLQNQEEQILAARKTGIPVQLVPPPGTSGPSVRDIRENVRLLMIDTHLYLQETNPAARQASIDAIEKAIKDAGDRHVLIAAHHPYASAGPHGELLTPMTKYLGIVYLLQRSGTLVQDLNSPIYGDLRNQLQAAFRRTRPPLAFIGGHDHSLQVHAGKTLLDPEYVLVSGGGSKSSDLVGADSLRYGTNRPGYMILTFRKRGAVDLFVMAGRDTKTADECKAPAQDGECMRTETDAFGIVYSERLAFRNPPPADTTPRSGSASRLPTGGRP